jgi:hypothetical protein
MTLTEDSGRQMRTAARRLIDGPTCWINGVWRATAASC